MKSRVTKAIRKMTDVAIECELRAVRAELEVAIRHGKLPASLGDYLFDLTQEQRRRARYGITVSL